MKFSSSMHEFLEASLETPLMKLKRGMDEILSSVHSSWDSAEEEVRGLFGAGYEVDEMALFFRDKEMLFEFMSRALRKGWRAFNCAEDVVETLPIRSDYAVEYWFLNNDARSYRLELMTVLDGFSPYHGSLEYNLDRLGRPLSLAHASFKVPDEATYGAHVVALRNAGLELMQHCSSSYGRFSYFIAEDGHVPVLKPRLNLRDASDA